MTSSDLGARWTQLNILAGTAVGLGLCVAFLLIRAERISADRKRLVEELQARLLEIKQLQGILPMCAYCKRIRDAHEYWQQLEDYLRAHSNVSVSHGICPSCYERVVAGDDESSIAGGSLTPPKLLRASDGPGRGSTFTVRRPLDAEV